MQTGAVWFLLCSCSAPEAEIGSVACVLLAQPLIPSQGPEHVGIFSVGFFPVSREFVVGECLRRAWETEFFWCGERAEVVPAPLRNHSLLTEMQKGTLRLRASQVRWGWLGGFGLGAQPEVRTAAAWQGH